MTIQPSLTPPTVLLVEDSPADIYIVRESLKKHLKSFQLEVIQDGEKAFDAIAAAESNENTTTPALCILDLNLPKRSGKEILKRIRGSPKFANVPVLIFTSSDSPVDRAETAQLGATAYFRKPHDLEEFMCIGKVVQSVLRPS